MLRQVWVKPVIAGLFCLLVSLPNDVWAGEIRVVSNFSGGSGEVLQIDQERRHVSIRPTPHPGRGWECWWSVRLEGVTPGELVTFEVGPSPWATPNQAAISHNGSSWEHSAIGTRRGKRITYRIPIRANRLHVAWGPPFGLKESKSLVDLAAKEERVEAFQLCRTREGRPVWGIHFQADPKVRQSDRLGVWIQARQHAWETGSSWVCRGVVDGLLEDGGNASWLRDRSDIYVIPVMDVDSVAIGAGGKNQKPQDHNRDWSDKPHWPAVAAAQKKIKQLTAQKQFQLFIDLHNPGASARFPYFYVPPEDTLSLATQRNQVQFLQCVRINMTEPLPFKGETQPSGAGYDANWRFISKNWVSRNAPDGTVSVTLETAWNTPHSHQRGYRSVGRQLSEAIVDYFKLQDAPISIDLEKP